MYIASGALRRLMRLRKGPVIAALYPIFMLILQLILAVGLGWIVGKVLSLFHPLLFWVGFGVVPFVLRFFQRYDSKFFVYYLMHDYAYSARWRGANPPDLEHRMTEFKMAILGALEEDYDEVLVVGHSSGAHLGISVVSDVLRSAPDAYQNKLSFLTLGQVVPMVSFLPDAWRLRADLSYLSDQEQVPWLDVTAPGDGCAFALCDPVAVSGVAGPNQKGPLVISAAFKNTLSPERYAELKRRYFRLHFQYMCAFDRPGGYDYFAITAGPKSLGERFEGRLPSPSRITKAASKFTSVAP